MAAQNNQSPKSVAVSAAGRPSLPLVLLLRDAAPAHTLFPLAAVVAAPPETAMSELSHPEIVTMQLPSLPTSPAPHRQWALHAVRS